MKYKLWSKEHQDALHKLLNAYKHKTPLPGCPLCLSLTKGGCNKCSWVVMTGAVCSANITHIEPLRILATMKGYYYHEFRPEAVEEFRQLRIKQLEEWIKAWEAANDSPR